MPTEREVFKIRILTFRSPNVEPLTNLRDASVFEGVLLVATLDLPARYDTGCNMPLKVHADDAVLPKNKNKTEGAVRTHCRRTQNTIIYRYH